MGTTAVSVLEQRLAQSIGDWIQVNTTTNITTNNSIISTALQAYDSGRDDYFIDWWVYITSGNNAAVHRQISDYATSTGTLTVRGAALAAESGAVTINIHRYNRDLYINALNDAIRETFPAFYKPYDVVELVGGNILPDSSFENWTSASALRYYTTVSGVGTLAKTTTAGLYRGERGSTSVKFTSDLAVSPNVFQISSTTYPRLLDLAGTTVNFYCWAYPQVANDAYITIYTIKADGTAQTLTSTTTCPASAWTLLKLENQAINEDVVTVTIKFGVTTNNKYVYFDNARLLGRNQTEYILPSTLTSAKVSSVEIQSDSSTEYWADTIQPRGWNSVYGWDVVDDATNKYLRLDSLPPSGRLMRLRGYGPLSTVSAYTDTIEIDGELINSFIAYAKYKLYQAIEGPVASSDIGRYELQSAKAYAEYQRLSHLRMQPPKVAMRIRSL